MYLFIIVGPGCKNDVTSTSIIGLITIFEVSDCVYRICVSVYVEVKQKTR